MSPGPEWVLVTLVENTYVMDLKVRMTQSPQCSSAKLNRTTSQQCINSRSSIHRRTSQDAYQYPNRTSYPTLYLKAKSNMIKSTFDDPAAIPIVAISEGGGSKPAIIGFCIWYRELDEEPITSTSTKKL
ncbi:hypothetical protein BBP40_003860 [Aspergillus hancockii]|nr:hypothetical protein BBP40_003860 [Aspergillus hancockii]